MGKNKARKYQKKKQTAALKAARRANAFRKKTPKSKRRREITADQFPDEDLLFWVCHGINFIVSDYGRGVWEPLFEGIYDGKLPEPETVAKTIMEKYGQDEEIFALIGQAAMSWSLLGRTPIYAYMKAAEKKVLDKDPDCDATTKAREPSNPQVWDLFNTVKQTVIRKQKAAQLTNPS